MRRDVTLWARTCLQCQCAKVSWHTRSEIGKFEPPSSRFEQVRIDLVRLLPPSEAFRYCLTCVDRHIEAAHNSISSGRKDQVERFHRQLKAAIMAHGSTQWTAVLPTILMISCYLEGGSTSHNCRDDL
ncbi:retrovirus-related Pol polyprotein from transposon 412 [Nephila pilipes]|uniref:Retrovirus-related Pol polyprotein from transposon 412 n=1 Tax=Nephila pilipes TaxID=299642 RepID=A0A8X6US38_NEPPI|nr:retrovirus-related Pol polyprotein from transposon 412 [Nephila pilipes]